MSESSKGRPCPDHVKKIVSISAKNKTKEHEENFRKAAHLSHQRQSKKINVYSIESNELLHTFPSLSECGRVLGLNIGNVCSVLTGRRNHTGGYAFKYV